MIKCLLVGLGCICIFSANALAGLVNEAEIPSRTIIIDGQADDWAGIPPILTDVTGDSPCGIGTDVTDIYLAKDSTYLYWRLDTASGTYDFGTSEYRRFPIVSLFEREGSPLPNGVTVNFNFPEGNPPEAFISEMTNNSDYVGLPEHSGIEAGTIDAIAEGRYPLSVLDQFEIEYLYAYYSSMPGGPCDEAMDQFFPPAPLDMVDFSNGWDIYEEGTVNFTVNSTELQFDATGGPGDIFTYGSYSKIYSNAVGAIGTLNVSSTGSNSNNDVSVGIRLNSYDSLSENFFLIELYLSEWSEQKRISYRIRERTSDGFTIRTISRGYFGDTDDNLWTLNDEITIGFAVLNNVVGFFTSAMDSFISVRLPDDIQMSEEKSVQFVTMASSEGPSQIISTIDDVYILTANNLRDLVGAGLVDGDANLDGKIGLEDVISALRTLTMAQP